MSSRSVRNYVSETVGQGKNDPMLLNLQTAHSVGLHVERQGSYIQPGCTERQTLQLVFIPVSTFM